MGWLLQAVQLLRYIPAPLLGALDGWSHRLALRRQRERQERWARRRAANSSL
jgi:hypothetical protein